MLGHHLNILKQLFVQELICIPVWYTAILFFFLVVEEEARKGNKVEGGVMRVNIEAGHSSSKWRKVGDESCCFALADTLRLLDHFTNNPRAAACLTFCPRGT